MSNFSKRKYLKKFPEQIASTEEKTEEYRSHEVPELYAGNELSPELYLGNLSNQKKYNLTIDKDSVSNFRARDTAWNIFNINKDQRLKFIAGVIVRVDTIRSAYPGEYIKYPYAINMIVYSKDTIVKYIECSRYFINNPKEYEEYLLFSNEFWGKINGIYLPKPSAYNKRTKTYEPGNFTEADKYKLYELKKNDPTLNIESSELFKKHYQAVSCCPIVGCNNRSHYEGFYLIQKYCNNHFFEIETKKYLIKKKIKRREKKNKNFISKYDVDNSFSEQIRCIDNEIDRRKVSIKVTNHPLEKKDNRLAKKALVHYKMKLIKSLKKGDSLKKYHDVCGYKNKGTQRHDDLIKEYKYDKRHTKKGKIKPYWHERKSVEWIYRIIVGAIAVAIIASYLHGAYLILTTISAIALIALIAVILLGIFNLY